MIVGIDYSMTCPAACLWNDTSPRFWFAQQRTYPALSSELDQSKITTIDILPRAEFVAHALLSWMSTFTITGIAIEDYAFSATGRVFHIGEHTGILKYLMWKQHLPVISVPPTVIKKYATGKGNADKTRMTAAFLEAYPRASEWIPHFFPRSKGIVAKSPLADLADAYWIAKYATTLTFA